ncbi:MAG: hypothetical protein BMS9Abin12_0520 [Acidimicrobiia bacterium]|nr:MAG: hypothetical protein BMS9Abin12_0520 [Acidimicrobiia bacterium]
MRAVSMGSRLGQLASREMYKRFVPEPGHVRIAALVIVAALLLAACSAGRPTAEEWQPTWERVLATMPSESAIGENPSQAVCDKTLAFLRSNRVQLFPTPDPVVDDTVRDWIDIAEDAFFECPPRNERVGSFSEAYGLLRRFQGEIAFVLNMDRTS